MILYLTLHKKWFDLILRNKKKIEYRDIKPYWTKRLFDKNGNIKNYEKIIFKNGYSKNSPVMEIEFKGIRKNKDKYEILLGNILSFSNIKN